VLDVVGGGSAAQRNWIYLKGGNVGGYNPSLSAGIATGTNLSSGSSETNLIWGQTVGTQQYLSIAKWNGTAVVEQMKFDSSGYVTLPGNTASSIYPRFSVGVGTGAVALTVNDGYGNCNVAFNHTAGIPDSTGSSARITADVDSSTAALVFSLGNSTTAGVPITLTTYARLTTSGLEVTGTTTSTAFSGPLTGNATTATTATNQSGGTVSATTGSFSGQLSVAQSTSLINNGINLNAAGNGFLRGTNNDVASSTQANVQLMSWNGIGFSPSIGGQAVPYGENAVWMDVRNGTLSARGTISAPTFSGNATTATALSKSDYSGNLLGSSRFSGTTYTNSTGRVLFVYIGGTNTPGNGNITVNIGSMPQMQMNGYGTGPGVVWPIPVGATYKFTNNNATIQQWVEF
jgi:hypothetical protein